MNLLTPEAVPGRPYWWDDVTWPEFDTRLPERSDLLIIGAGYTGLSAAIAAHDAGARVVVTDAGVPGEGASTRNGGMVGAHPRLSWSILASRYGDQAADALFAEASAALDWLRGLLKAERIQCDFEETGRIQLAYTKPHFAAQRKIAAQVSEKGRVACQILDREDVAADIATPLYKGGLLFPNHGGLHPAKFFLGLLEAVQHRGIPVLAHTPVIRMTDVKNGVKAVTPQGEILTDKAVLATNGYTGGQFPWFVRRVFAVPSYLIATEPLPSDLIAKLAPGRRMMVETRAKHSYFRISPDGSRFLFGGRAALVGIRLSKAARRLRETMVEIWPDLTDVKLSHVWTGNTGYTFGHMPHVGQRGRLYYALGYSGGGTVLAPWLGRKAALSALGAPEGETAFAVPQLTARWYHKGGRPFFLQGANLYYRHIVDKREDFASRRE